MSKPSVRSEKSSFRNWFVLLLAGAVLAWVLRPPRVVGLRQTIQYDDFAFEVSDVNVRRLAGHDYTIITLRVHNRAKRVDYHFNPAMISVKDGLNHYFLASPAGQRALEAEEGNADPCGHVLHAGASCTTRLVFDLPANLGGFRLLIQHGGWIGALVDDLIIGRQEIRLTP